MKTLSSLFKPLALASSVALAACGGSSGSDDDSGGSTAARTLTGTAAAGAAIVGTVTVKGALGNTRSALIEADGTYDVDVTGLTAPYRLRAQGTVGGKTYKLHSYAEEADVGGTVNITPFTDLIVANAAQTIAENFFDSNVDTSLDSEEVEAQEEALQSKLQDVFDALGLGTAIDLLNDSFSADHTGLDAALDLISIEVDSTTNIATITNLVENTSITDNVLDGSDNDESLTVSDQSALTGAVSDTQAIVNKFDSFAAEFAGGLPSSSDIEDYLAAEFLTNDESRGEFLTDITTDPELIDLGFSSISISDLDSTLGTATVTFNVVFEGEVDPESEVWFVARDSELGWQLLGDQRIVDLNTLSYHCNDYDALDGNPGGCGINVSFWDENFENNGTGGSPIASGTVKIIDGNDGTTVKDTIYLGTPDYVAPGEVQIYNASSNVNAQGFYSGDWRVFGSGLNEIDASIFAEGDIVEYNLYTQDLDVLDPTAPAVQMGTEVATYTSTILFEPSLTPLYPTATNASITAMQNFSLGDNLTIAWTLAAGTVSDEVLIEISDSMGNRLEIWDESFSGSTTSITVASTELDSAAAQAAGLDQNAESYELRVRIYAADEVTYQFHSVDYVFTIDGPAAGNGGSGSGLSCGYESGWDDNADGGFGAPINPNSFAEYEEVVADCGTAATFSYSDVAGNSFADVDETTTFFDTGSGTAQDPGTGQFNDGGEIISFEWYLEDANCTDCNYTYLVVYSDDTIDGNLPSGAWFRETTALIGISGTPGVAGSTYSFVKYSEQFNYSDNDRATGSDGEIWNTSDVLQ